MDKMPIAGEGPGLLAKLLSLVVGAALLVLLFTLSVLLFVALVGGGLMVWGYVWWKTRELRRQMREQMQMHEEMGEHMGESMGEPMDEQRQGGIVIEGEVIRDDDPPERR